MTFDEIFDEAAIDRSRNGSYSFYDLREVVSAMNRRFQPLLDASKAFVRNIEEMPDDTEKCRHLRLALNCRSGEQLVEAIYHAEGRTDE